MKKTAILATVLAAALCIAPLAACGENSGSASVAVDGKPFNMADYAIELPESSTVPNGNFAEIPAFKSVQALDVQLERISWSGYGDGSSMECAKERGTDENNGKWRLYNLKNSQSLTEWYSSISTVSDSPFLVLESAESEPTTYRLAYPTGEMVTSATFDSRSFSTSNGYYTVDGTSKRYYSVTYQTNTSEETAYVAFVDGAWKKLTEADIQPQQTSDDYQVGEFLGVVKTPLVEINGDEEDYPDYIYKDYSYTAEGESSSAINYTLYKGSEKLDSMMVFGGTSNVLGVVGKYFYYYESRPVSAEANSGYNFETSAYGQTEKYNMILHRYSITEKKDEVVNTNYIFMVGRNSGTLYNYSTNDFDRIVVTAYPKTNGVAIVSSGAPTYTLILDEDARVSFDMTGKNVSSRFYKLSDDRYFTGRTILDKESNTVATIPYSNATIWEEQSLILCGNYSNFIAVDYDGKVAIVGDTSNAQNIVVCGNSIVVTKYNYDRVVYSKSSPNGKTLDEIMGGTDYSTFDNCPLIYTTAEQNDTYTISFYNFIGTKVGEFKTANNNAFSRYTSPITCGGKYYFSATDEDSKPVTLVFA